jgi:type I restriction enzyme S subunit
LVERGKWQHKFKKQLNRRGVCDNVLSLTLRGVVNNNPDDPEGLVPKDYDTYQIFEKDDLVFKLIDLENFRTSRVGLVHERGVMSPAYIRIAPSPKSVQRYHYYLYYSLYQQGIYNKIGAGVRSTLNPTDLLEIPTLHPPRDEQDRIANFLDQKTAEIDEAIAKKQRLIELLKEQKAILINQAVTKGLNPNVAMRDSGVEWIGKVPEHWTGKKAKFLFVQSRLPVHKNDDVVTAYRDGQVTLRSNRRTEGYTIAILEQGYQGIRKGQLVLNSMDAFAGAIGVSDSDGKCSPEYVICDPIDCEEVVPMYYALLLREMALSGYIEVISSAVRQRAMRIRFNNLASLLLPVPPITEQADIVERVDDLKGRFDAVMDALNREIETINEYRAILIANTVTGKIKV